MAEVGVAAVYQHIAEVEVRQDLLDHGVVDAPAATMPIATRGRASEPTHSSIDSWPVSGHLEPSSSLNVCIWLVAW